MNTLTESIAPAGRPGSASRRAWGLAVPLLVAGALAAGCGAASSSPGAPAGGGTAASPPVSASATPAAGAPTGGAGVGSPRPTPSVPTVSGGPPVALHGADCTGWPAGLPSAPLPTSFVPVTAERCVDGTTAIPGKGLWTTATFQRSTGDLSRLADALRQPDATTKPGTICPAIAVIPPQVILINAAGDKLLPQFPAGECGLPAVRVVTALNSLHWQTVSVRLIAQIPGASPTAPVSGTAPHASQTATGGQVHPG